MPVIVSFDNDSGDDIKEYCNAKSCGGLLILRKDGSSFCTLCERIYNAETTKLHRKRLGPNDDGEPFIVPLSEYSNGKIRNPTPGEIEDRMLSSKKSGFHITSAVETDYDDEQTSAFTNQGIKERLRRI